MLKASAFIDLAGSAGSPRAISSGVVGISLRQYDPFGDCLLGFSSEVWLLRGSPPGVVVWTLMESLILAQDERWRRA